MRIRDLIACLSVAVLLPGCGGESEDTKTPGAQRPDLSGLDELSPEKRKLAQQQRICPVSEEPLGSMGKPVEMKHEGKSYFLCCASCIEKFRADPGKYVAKLED